MPYTWPHPLLHKLSHEIFPLLLPFQFRRLQNKLAQREIGYDDQELEFAETDEDLKKLIVYCRSVTIKPWDWKLQRETSVSEMFSFGEPTAVKLCKHFKQGGHGLWVYVQNLNASLRNWVTSGEEFFLYSINP